MKRLNNFDATRDYLLRYLDSFGWRYVSDLKHILLGVDFKTKFNIIDSLKNDNYITISEPLDTSSFEKLRDTRVLEITTKGSAFINTTSYTEIWLKGYLDLKNAEMQLKILEQQYDLHPLIEKVNTSAIDTNRRMRNLTRIMALLAFISAGTAISDFWYKIINENESTSNNRCIQQKDSTIHSLQLLLSQRNHDTTTVRLVK